MLTHVRVALIGVLALAAAAGAQTAPAPASRPAREAVLDHVPAGTLAFVVIHDVQAAAGRIDRFLKDTSLKPVLMDDPSLDLLDVLQALMQFSEGFDRSGGFAAAVLDPKPFDVDLAKVLFEKPAAPTKPEDQPKLPVVAYVPADSIEGLLELHPMAPQDGVTQVNMHFGTVFARQVGGYVALSPRKDALLAAVNAKTKAADVLSAERKAAIARADFAVHVHMPAAGALPGAAMRKLEGLLSDRLGRGGAAMGGAAAARDLLPAALDAYGGLLAQARDVTIAGRVLDDAVVLDKLVDFLPDSDMAKALAGFRPPAGPALAGVPNITYFFAMGAAGEPFATAAQVVTDGFWRSPRLAKVDAKLREEAAKLSKAARGQIEAVQAVVGLAPKDNPGVLGMVARLRCKDSAAYMDMVARGADLQKRVQAALGGEAAGQAEISLTRGADKLGDLSIDEMTVKMPLPKGANPMAAAMVQQLWGGDAMRILAVTPDAKTVLLAVGGKGLLAQAVESSKAGADAILVGEEIQAPLAFCPENAAMIALLHGANLQELMTRQTEALTGQRTRSLIRLDCKVPLMLAAAVTGQTVHGVLYVPKQLTKEAVAAITLMAQMRQLMEKMRPEQPAAPEGGENF